MPSFTLDFDNPPVVEVVLSTAFQPVSGLGVVDLVALWQEKYRASFPVVEEHPPYEMPVERFASGAPPTVTLQLSPGFPAPRLWCLSEAREELLQIQGNWFARNWRKMPSGSDYPLFPALRGSFETDLEELTDFLVARGMGELRPTQCEVTYINHVLSATDAPLGLHEILSVVEQGPSSLPGPESVRYGSQYLITADEQVRGRLYVTTDQANRRSDGRAVTVLTLTARGEPVGPGVSGVLSFLDLGREWISKVFASLTRPTVRHMWRERDGS